MEEESVLSLEIKTEEDKNQIIRRRSFSGSPSRMHSSAPSLHTTTAWSNGGEEEEERDASNEESPASPGKSEQVEGEKEEEQEGFVHLTPPKGWIKRIIYVLFLPLILLLFFTLPDVRKEVSHTIFTL
jgi:hypothetical protein